MLEVFKKISNPPHRSLMVWDGDCGFCRYWVLRLKRSTGDSVGFEPLQTASSRFPGIPEKEFRKSVRLITPSGNVYSGAAAIFKALELGTNRTAAFDSYIRNAVFRKISDWFYKKISKNRSLAYKVTVALWGKNPAIPKSYWLIYPVVILALAALIKSRT